MPTQDEFQMPKSTRRRPAVSAVPLTPAPEPEPSEDALAEAAVKALDKPEFSEAELLEIFDHILFSSEYQEDVIIRGRLKVTFVTRTTEKLQEIEHVIDQAGFKMMSTLQQERSLLNLEAALLVYNGKNLGVMKPEERSTFVRRLPGMMVAMLSTELQKFDRKVAAACQEGELNF